MNAWDNSAFSEVTLYFVCQVPDGSLKTGRVLDAQWPPCSNKRGEDLASGMGQRPSSTFFLLEDWQAYLFKDSVVKQLFP